MRFSIFCFLLAAIFFAVGFHFHFETEKLKQEREIRERERKAIINAQMSMFETMTQRGSQ